MKLNEVLLIAGSLLAALVLSKGGSVSSIFKKSSVPFMPLENKTISFIDNFPQIETYEQFFPVKDNLQLNNIINIEKKKKSERITYLQNELDQTENFISDQKLILNNPKESLLYGSDVNNILNKYGIITDDNTIEYYDTLVQSEIKAGYGGQFTNGQTRQFPRLTQGLTNYYEKLIASRNIAKANEYATRQQGDIDLINEEYQTRFGGLSRYG